MQGASSKGVGMEPRASGLRPHGARSYRAAIVLGESAHHVFVHCPAYASLVPIVSSPELPTAVAGCSAAEVCQYGVVGVQCVWVCADHKFIVRCDSDLTVEDFPQAMTSDPHIYYSP